MDRVTSNFAGRIRRETLNGRPHLVAPMVLIAEGVLAGSRGPLLYPQNELRKNVAQWNGMPLVIEHPTEGDRPISARQPSVLNARAVGTVLNARMDGAKLKAEGWFDIERVKAVAPEILGRLEAGQPIELSTGLFVDDDPTPGSFGGRAYERIARNHRADHVAVLPRGVGACSCKDGCGIGVNQKPSPWTPEAENWLRRVANGYVPAIARAQPVESASDDVLPLPEATTNVPGAIGGTEMLRRMGLDKTEREEVEAEQRRRTVSGLDDAQWALAAQEAAEKERKGLETTDLEQYVLRAEKARQMAKLMDILPPPPATTM